MSAPTTEIPGIASDADLEPGQVVGEYTVEGKLGQGAFGTVFKANHPLIGKLVAIKVLSRKFSVDPEVVSRFVAEARAVNQIRNRHIIDIFSFGQLPDGRQYYVMEYLDGEALDALVERETRVSLQVALPILRGIAKALDAAHAKGIAHRDLKAENVFLQKESDGTMFPKLLDFGIAKLMGNEDGLKHKTRTGISIGTPYYMSPEQARGRDVDHRTDIYAFGVLVYVMLTGTYPFDAEDYMSILMMQCTDEAEPPSKRVPELPASVDELVAWLMQKDPADRPDSLKTAIHALEKAAAEAGVAVAPPGSWDTGPGLAKYQTRPPNAAAAKSRISGGQLAPAPTSAGEAFAPPRSRTPVYAGIGAAALLIAGLVVMFAIRGDGSKSATRAPAPAPTAQPPAPTPTPTPTPTPPEVTAPPAGDPPAPHDVIVTVAGVPDGTEVLAAGKPIGIAPGPVQLPKGDAAIVLVFKADGFIPVSKSVTPDKDQPLSVTLKKKRSGGQKPGKDDIIDIFKEPK
jgi:serine/threonine protein kinase